MNCTYIIVVLCFCVVCVWLSEQEVVSMLRVLRLGTQADGVLGSMSGRCEKTWQKPESLFHTVKFHSREMMQLNSLSKAHDVPLHILYIILNILL